MKKFLIFGGIAVIALLVSFGVFRAYQDKPLGKFTNIFKVDTDGSVLINVTSTDVTLGARETNIFKVDDNGNMLVALGSGEVNAVDSSTSSISAVTFSGTGLNDMTVTGTYYGNFVQYYKVQIIATTTASSTIRWSTNNGGTWSEPSYDFPVVKVTTTPYLIANGVYIQWTTSTGNGRINNDTWTFTVTPKVNYINVGDSNAFAWHTQGGNLTNRAGEMYYLAGLPFIQSPGFNTFVGTYAGGTSTGIQEFSLSAANKTYGNLNTAVGYRAFENNQSGFSNNAFGYFALRSNTEGVFNTANGNSVMYHNTTGDSNVAMGLDSLYENTDGNQNTSIGTFASFNNTLGDDNSILGFEAFYGNTTGNSNSCVGYHCLYTVTSSDNNICMGRSCLALLESGSNNIALGKWAGFAQTSGSNNIIIGNGSDLPLAGQSNTLNISNLIWATGLSDRSGGDTSALSAGSVGIGTSTPVGTFQVSTTSTNGTTTLTWGKAGTKGTCITVYSPTGTPFNLTFPNGVQTANTGACP